MVRYSTKAAKALAFLKRKNNDIDIYVEDTGNLAMWSHIVKRSLPDGVKFKSVHMIGGRDAVIAACKLDQSKDGRKKLYIIDGDFDFLNGKSKPRLKYLYRIRAYCIENLLINTSACQAVSEPWCPTEAPAQVAARLDFPLWLEDIYHKFQSLFVVYAAAHNLVPEQATVAHDVSHFYDSDPKGPTISSSKVYRHILTIARIIRKKCGISNFRKELSKIKTRVSRLEFEQSVSGKDYILPVLKLRLSALFGFRPSHEQLKAHLATKWDVKAEPYLGRAIRNACA